MKKLLLSLFILVAMIATLPSCNLSKTAVVRDTVKDVVTTTADYYKFYHPAYGEGRLKDYHGTIKDNSLSPELPIRIVPATAKQDQGYFIIKPASAINPSEILPDGSVSNPNELVLKQGDFRPIQIPQRGN